jgi:hypothetical protein
MSIVQRALVLNVCRQHMLGRTAKADFPTRTKTYKIRRKGGGKGEDVLAGDGRRQVNVTLSATAPSLYPQ